MEEASSAGSNAAHAICAALLLLCGRRSDGQSPAGALELNFGFVESEIVFKHDVES